MLAVVIIFIFVAIFTMGQLVSNLGKAPAKEYPAKELYLLPLFKSFLITFSNLNSSTCLYNICLGIIFCTFPSLFTAIISPNHESTPVK